jgi:hypothetical protein
MMSRPETKLQESFQPSVEREGERQHNQALFAITTTGIVAIGLNKAFAQGFISPTCRSFALEPAAIVQLVSRR